MTDKTGVTPGPGAGVVAGSAGNLQPSPASPEQIRKENEAAAVAVAGQPAMLEETLKGSVATLPPIAPLHEKQKASNAQTAKTIIPPGTVQADSTPALRSAAGLTDKTSVTPGPGAGVVAGSAGKVQPSPASPEQIRKDSNAAVDAGQPAMLEENLEVSVAALSPVVAPVHEKEKASKAQIAKRITPEGTVQASSVTPASRSAAGVADRTGVKPGLEADVLAGSSGKLQPSPASPEQIRKENEAAAVAVAGQPAIKEENLEVSVAALSPVAPVHAKEQASKAQIARKGSSPELGETTMAQERATAQPTPKAGKPSFLSDALSTTGTFLGGSIVAVPYGIYKAIETVAISPDMVQADSATPVRGSAAGVTDKAGVTPGPGAEVAVGSGGKLESSSAPPEEIRKGNEAAVAGQPAMLEETPKVSGVALSPIATLHEKGTSLKGTDCQEDHFERYGSDRPRNAGVQRRQAWRTDGVMRWSRSRCSLPGPAQHGRNHLRCLRSKSGRTARRRWSRDNRQCWKRRLKCQL